MATTTLVMVADIMSLLVAQQLLMQDILQAMVSVEQYGLSYLSFLSSLLVQDGIGATTIVITREFSLPFFIILCYIISRKRGNFMQLPDITILDEKDKRLRLVSKEVSFPLSNDDKKNIKNMLTYLRMSQIDELREKYDLRAGMGLSYIQIGISKRIFVVVDEIEPQKFKDYIIINPTIQSMSEELIYVGEGEGCLSINRETKGIVPRNARITVHAFDMDGNPFTLRVREDLSVAFQHEMDHLNGILFIDKIDPKNPYKNANKMREI